MVAVVKANTVLAITSVDSNNAASSENIHVFKQFQLYLLSDLKVLAI